MKLFLPLVFHRYQEKKMSWDPDSERSRWQNLEGVIGQTMDLDNCHKGIERFLARCHVLDSSFKWRHLTLCEGFIKEWQAFDFFVLLSV